MITIICAAAGVVIGGIIGYFTGVAATWKAVHAFIEGENNVKRD